MIQEEHNCYVPELIFGHLLTSDNYDGGVSTIQEEHNCYVPELISGRLLTSDNYDDKEKQVTGGRNGYGAKLTNVFSTKLDKLSHKINELIERKGNLQIAIGDKRQEGVKMRNQLNKMKKSIGFTSKTDIDERIASGQMAIQDHGKQYMGREGNPRQDGLSQTSAARR